MTITLMTHYPDIFKVGVAGGPVIDWKYYEVMYGERYMDTPQANPEGYRIASVLSYTEGLENPGYLRITHGTGDDNVHFQNTLLLVDALQKAGVQFELMIYPDGMHGYRGAQKKHSDESDHLFWTRHLLQGE